MPPATAALLPLSKFSASLAPGYPLGDALRDITNLSKTSLPANAKITFSGSSSQTLPGSGINTFETTASLG